MILTRHRQGFTLVELSVVVVLIGIMLSLIIPEMQGTYEDALLRASARKIVSVCSLAHSQSITTGEDHRVRLDLKRNRYTLERQGSDSDSPSSFREVRNLPDSQGSWDDRIQMTLEPLSPSQPASSESDGERPGRPRSRNDQQEEPVLDEPGQNTLDSIVFHPDGTCDPVQAVLTDRAKFEIRLALNPVTSRIRLTEPERK